MASFDQKGSEGRRSEGVPADLNSGLKFFGNRICPYAHRAWWSIAEKNAEVDYIHIDLGDDKPAWFAASVNPEGTVPCLYDNGNGIFESMPICEYLEDKFKGQGTALLPTDPLLRARIRVFLGSFGGSGLVGALYKLLTNQDRSQDAALQQTITTKLHELNALFAAQSSSGPYFLGDALSLADIAVATFLERFTATLSFYRDFNILPQDDKDVARLSALLAAVRARPAFQKTTAPADLFIAAYRKYAKSAISEIKNEEWIFASPPTGEVTEDVMKLQSCPVPTPQDGEVLIQTTFISVDPYMRGRMRVGSASYVGAFEVGAPLNGGVTGVVIQSRTPDFAVGDHVQGQLPWRRYVTGTKAANRLFKLSTAGGISPSLYLGVLGMPGMSAYFPTVKLAHPKEGETVFISGAAGAVGSAVGQICKILGCTVVGSVGSDEKVAAAKQLGFDHAFNYKKVATAAALAEFCPKGVDVYWDNVGGETLDATLVHMNVFGRIIACGMISQYNKTPDQVYGLKNLMLVVGKQLSIHGFIVSRWADEWASGVTQMAEWVKAGKVQPMETVVEGFEKVAATFVGLFHGENTGKLVIKV